MGNKLKKILSLLLSFILTASCVTFNFQAVFANLQTHVRDVVIRPLPQTGNIYNINFTWTNPSWSTSSDPDADEADRDYVHKPEGYRVMERNITGGRGNYENVSGDLTGEALTSATIARNLTTGSLYAYRIIPYHMHTYTQPDNTRIKKEAPYDSSKVEDVLFMTDLEVEASGSGNNLTVTWDNPLYNNKDIFQGYRIYYQRGGQNVTNFNNYKDVSIENEDLIRINDELREGVTRLQYTINDTTLAQGEVYAVKVEPLYAGSEIRKLTNQLTYANITINDIVYKLSFNSYTTNEYRTNNAYISIPLEILENGKDYLNLHWWGLSNTIGNIEKVEVYKGPAENDIGLKIGTIYSPEAIYVNYWQIDKPTEVTYYQIKIFIQGMEVPLTSEIAVYDPNAVNITPNKPKLFAEVNQTASTNTIDAYWNVFKRYPYNESEQEFIGDDGMYIDTNVKYDLWITDNLDNLWDINIPKTLDSVTPGQLTQTNIEDANTPVYYSPLTKYTTKDETGAYVTKDIAQNKVYYLKLIVSKPTVTGDLSAQPVYASQYFPIKGDIATPQSLGKPPLKIKEDDDGNQIITNNSIDVEWRTKWFEVYDSKTDSWYSKASVNGSEILFGDEATTTGAVDFYGVSSPEKVKELFQSAGLSEDALALLPVRQVDLNAPDIKYEMLYLPYKQIEDEEGGYESYLEKVMKDETIEWNQITPVIESDILASYSITGLDKNTTYTIIIRPYRILDDGQKDAYPSYVMGTTLPDQPVINITPTVPILDEETHDDMSITVKWQEYLESLEYELSYSTLPLDDPASGTIINMEDILENGEQRTEDEISKMFYKIKNLIPSTGYYIWIRVCAPNNGNPAYSAWSNPLYVITDELRKPDIPDGLGLVAKDTLGILNNRNDTQYEQRKDDYMILEWNRNEDDLGESPAVSASGEGYEVFADPDIQATIVAKMNNLTPNTDYYARVKARVTINVAEDGSKEKLFTYILQFALNRDFKDALTIVIPEGEAEIEETPFIKESDWCSPVRFKAGPTDKEYDGNIIDSHYPLPDDDFEYIYDGFTRTLTYRFRSNKEDEDGLDDNYVDQRFISTLLTKQLYQFDVDLTHYNNYDIKNRVIEIPYSIMEAFGEHDITLYFKADNITFGLYPDFIKNNQVEHLAGYGQGASVKITAAAETADAPLIGFGQTFSSKPQKLSVDIVTPSYTYNVKQFYKDVGVAIKLYDKYTLQETNVDAYYDTDLTTDWQRYDSVYNEPNGVFIGNTKIPATFSAIRRNSPGMTTNDSNAVNSLIGVNSKIAITDVQNLKPNSVLSTVQFNNIVAAVANGKKDVAINGALSDDDYKALSRKGIIIEAPTVSREEGINALVKLYEVKTGRPAAYTPLELTSCTDISDADPKFTTSLLKAADLGFYGNTYGARPKDTMNIADMLYIVDIILRDSNY